MNLVAPDHATRTRRQQSIHGRFWPCLLVLLLFLSLAGCAEPESPLGSRDPITIELAADGQRLNLTTTAGTVRDLLDEAGLTVGELDEVTPPLFTPLAPEMTIRITRVEERLEIISEPIPFERKIVRSDAMDPDDPPRIVQAGADGLQDVTVRIVSRDGIETEQWVTQTTVIEPATDEIVMVGIAAARTTNVSFAGILAYISGGNAVVLRGNSAFPETLAVDGPLDGRVFTLSPRGDYLLYTQAASTEAQTTGFSNNLWIISTSRGAEPVSLGVGNVLWAGWNPARSGTPQIAYTTARSTNQPPGWSANNDLWLGELPDEDAEFEPVEVVEDYPATYGWWGGNYAWSPTGSQIAFSYANEIGVIDLSDEEPLRLVLQRFTEYDTLQDWVWVPTLSWSPDGRFLAFTQHGGDRPDTGTFDTFVLDTITGINGRFMPEAGMWAHPHWNITATADTPLVFLRALNPLDSLRSSYALWQMDQDGSNARQLYPPPGENSFFPRQQQFMAWGPSGRDIAFIFDDKLVLYNLDSRETRRVAAGDDTRASLPTWAPYGQALTAIISETSVEEVPTAVPESESRDNPPPRE